MDGIMALALAKKYTDQVGQQIISAGFKVQVEQDRSILNGQGQEKILYLLPKASGSTGDGYDEFVYAQNSWEWIGKTDIDLNYELLSEKPQINGHILSGNQSSDDLGLQNKLTAGTNIKTINNISILGSGNITIESTSWPIPVIFDTDFWTDVDDAVAIRELIWAERQGICDIVGVIVDAVNSDSAKAFARYLDYEGRGDLQFALEKNATDYSGTPSYFNTIISSWSTGIYESNNDAPDENEGEYYIKLLQSLPEGKKCRIICVGYLSALAGLLNRAEQDQQIMNLILNKVEKIFIMGGKYPSGSENNFNRNARAKTAAYNVCSKCPSQIPIVFLGYEVGESVTSGGTTGTAIGNFDLLYKCMVAHGEGSNGRSSWDPMTVLLALADDTNQSGYTYTRGTNVVNSSTGANTFIANDNGSHYYVTKKYPDAWYGKFIDSICERKAWGFRKVGDLSYNEQLVLQSIVVTTNPSTPTYVGETFNTTGMVVTGTYLTSGGEAIQKQVYNYSYSPNTALSAGSQTITITYTEKEVTATTTITITVLEYPVYNITTSVTNGTYSGSSTISANGTATVTVTANTNYHLPNSITVNNAQYTYTKETGAIILSNATDNVSISVVCESVSDYTITTTVGNGEYTGDSTITPNGTATVTVTANVGYSLPSAITVTGATYNYDSTTGTITLSNPTENVTISVTCIILSGYATVTLNGTESWQFNTSGEPNTYGFYNCYILGAIPNNIKHNAAVGVKGFEEASCNNSYFNRNIDDELRTETNSPGFGFHAADPSLYFRFDNTIATTTAGFKTYLTNNPIQITYKTNS